MFRSAATKIAHNSTLPALAINQDLRPLQDLITAEKAVILSLVSSLSSWPALTTSQFAATRDRSLESIRVPQVMGPRRGR